MDLCSETLIKSTGYKSEKQSWASLHTHSEYSKDGMGKLSDLVAYAKEMNFEHLGLTDHGTLAGVPEFISLCNANGIKPVVGGEYYFSYNGFNHTHLTLIASGQEGYNTLVKINNEAYLNPSAISKTGIHSVDLNFLLNNNKGLFVTTGCPASIFHQLEFFDALELAKKFKNIMGKRFLAEIMVVTDNKIINPRVAIWEKAIKFHEILGIELFFSNDVHYTKPEYSQYASVYKKITGQMDYDSSFIYLADTEDIKNRVRHIDKTALPYVERGMINSIKISEFVKDYNIINTGFHVPKSKFINGEQELRKRVWDNFGKLRPNQQTEEVKRKIEHELEVICDNGYADYFLITEDIVSIARKKGSTGDGRGSASGSLVSYLIGITNINPLDYGLMFERFLTKQRASGNPPDIDIDISSLNRPVVLNYANSVYGGVGIAAHSFYKPKSLLRAILRHLNIPLHISLHISEKFDGVFSEEEEILKNLLDEVENEIPEFNDFWKEFFWINLDTAIIVSQHAGGIVIVDKDKPVPLIQGGIVAYSKNSAEKAGLLKFDFLGLSTLDVINELEGITGDYFGDPLDYNNHDMFNLISEDKTLGIFQFKGSAIRNLGKGIKPVNIEEVSDITAMARPAVLQSGLHQEYVKYHNATGYVVFEATKTLKSNVIYEYDGYYYDGNDVAFLTDGSVKYIKDLEEKDEICKL